MNVEKGSQVIYISRVRYARMNVCRWRLGVTIFRFKYAFLLEERFDDNSLFTFLKEHSHTAVAISEKWVELCKGDSSRKQSFARWRKELRWAFIKSVWHIRLKEPIYVGIRCLMEKNAHFYVSV